MKAMVCDKCGKVVLLPDNPGICPDGISTLYMSHKQQEIDLCDECVDELVQALRKGVEDGNDKV